jgi:hypothetical protein
MKWAAFILGVLCLWPGATTAQRAEEEQFARITRSVIVDVRSRLRPKLTEDEREILDQIDFTADPIIAVAGVATNQNGRRKIVISSGTAFLMNVLGQSAAVGYRGNVRCMQIHMLKSIKDAFEGMDPRTNPRNRPQVFEIRDFARIERACEGADRLITGDVEAIAATTRLGVALVVLHEIAHHVLEHLEETPSLRRSRLNEIQADRWALWKAVEIGEPLLLATPYLLVMTASGLSDITLEGERAATHPNGTRRALEILEEVEQDVRGRSSQEMLRSIEELRRRLENLVPK